MANPLHLRKAKQVIATLWFTGAGVPLVLLIVQSLVGHYGSSVNDVWRWYLGAISPTLGLIVAVVGADALHADSATPRFVDRLFFYWATGISSVYLLSLWGIFLVVPLRNLEDGLPQLIRETGGWLTPLQAFVTGALGVLFVRKKDGA